MGNGRPGRSSLSLPPHMQKVKGEGEGGAHTSIAIDGFYRPYIKCFSKNAFGVNIKNMGLHIAFLIWRKMESLLPNPTG